MFGLFKKKKKNISTVDTVDDTVHEIEINQEEDGVKIEVLSADEIKELGFRKYRIFKDEGRYEFEGIVRFTNMETNQIIYVGLRPLVAHSDTFGEDRTIDYPARLGIYNRNMELVYEERRDESFIPFNGKCHRWPYSVGKYKRKVEERCAKLENSGYKGFLVRALKAMAFDDYNKELEITKRAISAEKKREALIAKREREYRKLDTDVYAAFSQKSR